MNITNELIPTRQSLLSRLKDWNDQESWKVFFDTYWKLIYSAGVKAGLTDAEAQDVVQETVLSVLKSMPNFDYDAEKGSFKGWLLRLTSWRIVDQIRKRQRDIEHERHESPTSTETDCVERVVDPLGLKLEAVWEEEWEKNLMEAAIERVKKKVEPKQYQIFDLYVFKSWPASKVAQVLKVSAGKVYLTKHRISHLIKKEITHLRTKPI
ncbi:MAG: polymerase, sigma-24 subunit, subfamily [Pedosphaera sp.]|nr:polymerase, sigma-24 subunit, subfamily [Pedosphaera sp.]